MKIIADNKIPFLKGVFEPFAEVVYLPGKQIDADAVKDADAMIIRTRTKCNAALLKGSKVKHIATATIGFDHINTAEVESLGISWNNAPGCNANSVGQYMVCALQTLGMELEGKTIGIIGVGHVGSIVADYAHILGMNVLRNDPPRQDAGEDGFVGLDFLLEHSDVITLHVPLEYEGKYPTFHMADEKFFAKMKKKCVFFNASRGEAVKTSALKKATADGTLSQVILDVWEDEPEIDRALMENVFISTMHIAGYSTDGKANGTTASVRAVAQVLDIPELLSWSPAVLPEPPEEKIIKFTSLPEVLLHTYDPRNDSSRLRNSPESFEELRGSYPVRREFQAFTVTGVPEDKKNILQHLGFRIG
ncbi:MAG: 4-phosphoerythronate dehydrogenase [Lentisphaeria bacterium]|nr:4-phosphoerythronate dehydrogenase [Lentisphaeria bacterium]